MPVEVGWVGCSERSLPTIANIVARGGVSLNGMAPVRALVQTDDNSPDVNLEQIIRDGLQP